MINSSNPPIDSDTLELLKRAATGRLTSEDEQRLERLLDTQPHLHSILAALALQQEESGVLKRLSEPSLPTSLSLLNAMQRMVSVGGQEVALTGIDGDDPTSMPNIGSENISLIRKLGQGGMGVVYEGIDRHLGRAVAVKLIAGTLSRNAKARELLIGEAQAAAQLHHENIVAIHSIHLSGEQPYIVQQFVRGESLGQRLDRVGKLKPDELLQLSIQLGRGLVAAHRFGLIHRDLKPDNVLLEEDSNTARIADFGLALRKGASDSSNDKVIAGTPTFMSPEQTLGKELDARSDLFSLGSLLYKAATGVEAFPAKESHAVMEQIRELAPTPIESFRKDLPTYWTDAVYKLLRKSPEDRYPSASEFLDAIQQPLDSSRPRNRIAWVSGVVVVSLALLATIAVSLNMFFSRAAISEHRLIPPVDNRIWFELVGSPTRFRSIADAVLNAEDHGVLRIHGKGEHRCDSISIDNKSLTIEMLDDAEVVLRPVPLEEGKKESFISTNAPLRLVGIHIESDRHGEIELPIQSIVESVSGELQIERCKISGRGFMACVFARTGRVAIKDSELSTPEGPVIVGPQTSSNYMIVNSRLEGTTCILVLSNAAFSDVMQDVSSFEVDQSSLFGRSVLRVVMGRQPFVPANFMMKNSIDACQNEVIVSTLFPRRDDLQNAAELTSFLRRTIVWSEDHCVHGSDVEFVCSMGLLPKSQVSSSQLRDWKKWTEFWKLNPETSLQLDLKTQRIENRIDVDRSMLPAPYQDCGHMQK